MNDETIRVLLVEGDAGNAQLIQEMLAEARGTQFDLTRADRLSTGLEHLAAGGIDIALLDLSLPDSQGLDTFTRAHAQAPRMPIIVLAGLDDEALAIQAVQKGAQDYVVKGQRGRDLLVHAIRYAIERKRAEEQKERIQVQFLQTQKMEAIGTLASEVAHDFNNMLAVVQGYVDLAIKRIDETDPLYGDLMQIHLVVDRAVGLTHQLLLFGRKQPVRFTPLNVNQTVDDLLRVPNRLVGEDIVLGTDLDPDLWTVQADAGNMEQALVNLVINAREAMPEGGKLTIKTENVTLDKDHCQVVPEARPGKFVCLSVVDTGAGMDEETIQHIFEPFFATRKDGKDTRLGLPVAYGIVKQHEGWISVHSEPGKGSTFKVYLPAHSVKPEDKPKEPISRRKFRASGKRILMVEDERNIRKVFAKALRESGYIVHEAGSAKEALDIFEREQNEFHLVFSDAVLPGETGLQLIDQLLSRQPELPILLSSGYTANQSRGFVVRERELPFLQKPYNVKQLLRAIREAIGSA